MNRAALVKELIRLRKRGRPDEAAIAALTKAQLYSRPECLVVAIVEGFLEMRKLGHAEQEILREIEARRERAFGEEPLPGDLTLDSYARYRLRVEYPGDEGAHEPVFVMQAVQHARERLESRGRYSDPGIRGRPVGMIAVIACLALVLLLQGLGSLSLLARPGPAGPVLLGCAVLLALAAVGYYGLTVWGAPLLRLAVVAEATLPWTLIGQIQSPEGRFSPPAILQGVNTVAMVAILVYLQFGRRAEVPGA